jgi:uncharacterized protein (DUF1697 family)
MPKYVAFLRAINVGGHVVKMDHLRTLFEGIGFSNVETFIASGNVIFDSKSKEVKALEKKIENQLEKALGYKVATFLRTPDELLEIIGIKPFKGAEKNAHALYIGFVPDFPTDESKKKLMSFRSDTDDFHVNSRQVYWLCREKMSRSNFSYSKLERMFGMPATFRNVTTVQKLAEKYRAK